MIDLTTYIIEKFKISKDIEVSPDEIIVLITGDEEILIFNTIEEIANYIITNNITYQEALKMKSEQLKDFKDKFNKYHFGFEYFEYCKKNNITRLNTELGKELKNSIKKK